MNKYKHSKYKYSVSYQVTLGQEISIITESFILGGEVLSAEAIKADLFHYWDIGITSPIIEILDLAIENVHG